MKKLESLNQEKYLLSEGHKTKIKGGDSWYTGYEDDNCNYVVTDHCHTLDDGASHGIMGNCEM